MLDVCSGACGNLLALLAFAHRQKGAQRHLALTVLHPSDDNCRSPADKPLSKYFSSRMHIY